MAIRTKGSRNGTPRAIIPGQKVSEPISGLTQEEVQNTRAALQGYFEYRGEADPLGHANQVIRCCIDATKYDKKSGQFVDWYNAPGMPGDNPVEILNKRAKMLTGTGFKRFLTGQPTASAAPRGPGRPKKGTKKTKEVASLTDEELKYMERVRRAYMKEFKFESQADLSLLDQLIWHEAIAKRYREEMVSGATGNDSPRSAQALKHVTDSIRNLQKDLGITALQRGSEKNKNLAGTAVDFIARGRATMQEYPELEQKWLLEELTMLLDKYNRRKDDGTREISATAFYRVSGGISVHRAYKLLNRTPPEALESDCFEE